MMVLKYHVQKLMHVAIDVLSATIKTDGNMRVAICKEQVIQEETETYM